MLSEIYIKNYILVPELRLQFGPGLTVITGETGAGKSILVGSVALILGDSAYALEAYDPAQPIYLESSFIPPQSGPIRDYLTELNSPTDEELVLAREISPAGKSSYFIGGRKVSAQVMKSLKPLLLDFHHQRDQQRLLSTVYQLEILDRYAGSTELCKEFGAAYRELKRKEQLLAQMQAEDEAQQQKLELYRYQYAELEKADLKIGEDKALQQEFELQEHGREILDLAHGMNSAMFEAENSIFDRLGTYQAQLERFRELGEHIAEAGDTLLEAREALRGTSMALSSILDTLSYDPSRMTEIEKRLDTINSLLHKHKVPSVEDLLALFAVRAKDLGIADDFRQQISALQKSCEADAQELALMADKLSLVRRTAGAKLAKELQKSIRHLALEQAQIQIEIDKKVKPENVLTGSLAAFTESGQDEVEILFSANPGSSLKPLSHVASGGELSRILLGIKQVLALRMSPKLLILDEIDAGVGGKTAELMAAAIASISRQHPVLCITHLAQIAAYANTHIAVEKVSDAKTSVVLRVLDDRQRVPELARMLSGNVTGHALKHAEELIEKNKAKEEQS